MSISPSKARALCTESEYNLVKWSSPRNVKTLAPSKLKDKIDRARKLRDKYRDLANKQRGEERGKRKPTGAKAAKGNERTVMKADLFAQTLERFQKALEEAEDKPSPESKISKKTKSSKKSAKKSSTSSRSKSKSKAGEESAKTGKSASSKPAPRDSSKKKASSTSKPASPSGKPIPLAGAPSGRGLGGGASLSGSSSSSAFSTLFTSSLADQQSRETRRREKSQSTKIGREQSRFAATSREKIQGHVSAQTRRSQAKRDSKG